jgi:hypothetical protein
MNTDTDSSEALMQALREMVVTEDPAIEYRLHYDEDGNVIMCSMQSHPESDRYVVVDKKTYDMYFRYRIVDGKPMLIVHDNGVKASLVKSTRGFKVAKNHAALLVEPSETLDRIEYYDKRNS